ncbi:AAA domain containing protein [uncultured Caudovirales phage]|uniref:AAA domain containing protein n=1 Tax=uncultured Caudovirales phage TaxID=2100421 RepID=A0A6J5RQL7_9CAUD|nr:AAA domain containing protein [uncultured Caudovirales phage]CAB4170887.1 AAA domain containing protein [uncultured Caudovirales phage]CAB4198322.1 AAA domain containing protein [uncultured Caudovirales phage]
MNVFEAVRVKGKLMAKNVKTGEFAANGVIRTIQLLNAERDRQLLMVAPNGRVTRIASADTTEASAVSTKMSFLSVVETRDPETMFGNLERLTKMVGRGIQPSLVITGMAGVGKTHLVKETLKQMGLRESYDFEHFKGKATAAGLYMTLYANSDKIVVLDDCDSVFKDDDAVNILKAALDSYDTRQISYISTRPLKDEFGEPIPTRFEFTGKIIFISNINQSKLDEAIRSRSFVADISMNTEQMFLRMEQLMQTIESKIPMPAKQQALAIMKALHAKYDGVDINLRSFIKAARIAAMGFPEAELENLIAEQIIAA